MRTSSPSPYPGTGSLLLITHEDGERLNRWTFVPEDIDDNRRFTAWISADPSTVVDLDERR